MNICWLQGRQWWREQEEPWQILACCKEIVAAMRNAEGVTKHVSQFPVHQDGSCNGLQHYAALGRDERGAESVSLRPLDAPQDVYGDVTQIVEEQRREDAENGVEIAKILEGFVQRKVIKQSVMTTVYGVTLYGAILQIKRQLKDLEDFPKQHIQQAAVYLARSTLSSIGKIFTSSRAIQEWFNSVSIFTRINS
ncbi:hypothetical protein Ciccas_004959 [Cichlidogyrus casuarinus]|uniref:DNA-directed RNA polymerase n=1 Tax=Cichlidogyrus casuarinus TaxID=1844966 RepID=A0ABD2QA27_9PLAT